MKVHFFGPKDLISMIGIFAIPEFLCNFNKIHECAAMWALHHYVEDTVANALNSRMCVEKQPGPLLGAV